jgi:putative methyltransferase (TIGR04325 family)
MSEEPPSRLQRLRLWQIRALAAFLERISSRPGYARALKAIRENVVVRPVLGAALGFRKKYNSFSAASRAAGFYRNGGHENSANAIRHFESADRLRESDYAVLYYWSQIRPAPRRVLDLGGSVGNLFYVYNEQLHFCEEMTWNIVELPELRLEGERIAASRNERRVRYLDSIRAAGNVDVFLASGSLHYFDESLPELLARMAQPPRHVFVNRVPTCEGEGTYTVQDAWSYLVPCKIRNRSELIAGMVSAGYRAAAVWDANEMREIIPLYPESSAFRYSGFYFVRP